MPRIKTTTHTYQSLAEFEKAVDDIAKKQLKLDQKIADFNAKKAAEDKAHKAAVKKAQAEINETLVSCESYVAHNREEILGARQSGETALADFGFRKSPGIIKTLNTKFTFTKAKDLLKAAGKLACIKVTETLDKQAVSREIPEAELPKYGLRKEYPEEFWFEPKRAIDPQPKRL